MKTKSKYTAPIEKQGQVLMEKWGRYMGEEFYRADIPNMGIFSGAGPRQLKEKIMDSLIERRKAGRR
jgi:hypothetical protein